jgi:Mrp family chromosome partitioning ATPase
MMSDCEPDFDSNEQGGQEPKTDFRVQLNEMSQVKKTIAVISGKGGVGKSMVSSMLAVTLQRRGMKTAVLDADLTGPSIPKIFGLKGKAGQSDFGILPMVSKTGIEIMSINCLIENETDPVVWRGPLIAKTVQQFWTEVVWDEIDCMIIDMPPGTGDVPLTVFQSLPIDGIIIVTSPQDLVSMVVSKSVRMAEIMNVPIIGIVENMSYAVCPVCQKPFDLFGKSHTDEIAKEHHLNVLGKLPVDPVFANACDRGLIELMHDEAFLSMAEAVEEWKEKKE